MKRYPMKLIPVCKDLIWGGTALSEKYHKGSASEKIGESWELTVREDGMSVIANGEYSGMSLKQYLTKDLSKLGYNANPDCFPLLVKFIDACEDLSVQVHPDNSYATTHENECGKNELWYVIHAEEDAEIIYGLKGNLVQSDLRASVSTKCFEQILNHVKVHSGDVFYIPAGQIHSICHGVFIAEIQQNSNLTYRIFDYDRISLDGKKRELHISKALDVIKVYSSEEIEKLQFTGKSGRRAPFKEFDVICDCDYFRSSSLTLPSNTSSCSFTVDESSFVSLLFTDAEDCFVECSGVSVDIFAGDSVFIPAGSGEVTIGGKCHILLSEC